MRCLWKCSSEVVPSDDRWSNYTFDSFDCAIQAVAPVCPHCHCKIIGTGVESKKVFCSMECALYERHLEQFIKNGFSPFRVNTEMNGATAGAAS